MTDQFFRDWPTIIRRAFFEAILPLLGGCFTVLVAWWQKSSLLAALSGFGIGYLFVLSVQGQVLRIAKNVRDEATQMNSENRLPLYMRLCKNLKLSQQKLLTV
jgi:hypothetical protein